METSYFHEWISLSLTLGTSYFLTSTRKLSWLNKLPIETPKALLLPLLSVRWEAHVFGAEKQGLLPCCLGM